MLYTIYMLHKEYRDESIWGKIFRVVLSVIKVTIKVIVIISLIIFIIFVATWIFTSFSSKDEESTNAKEERVINNSKYEGVHIEEVSLPEDLIRPIKLKKIIRTFKKN